jgi:hypothetical protein
MRGIINADEDNRIVVRANPPKVAANNAIFSLKVTLRGLKPPIWRRLLVPGSMTLGDLHIAIQAAMGWADCHLHVFDIAGEHYGDQTVDEVADENRLTLNSLARSGVTRFTYTYDFGDDWEHTIAIEKRVPAIKEQAYPTCTAGKRGCPPEDCGGVWGYSELLAILADPTHPHRADYDQEFLEDINPDDFDVGSANIMLAARFSPKQSPRT